jgi:hypothetical protein
VPGGRCTLPRRWNGRLRCGTDCRNHYGRPTKVEGQPGPPRQPGSKRRFTQASIANMRS